MEIHRDKAVVSVKAVIFDERGKLLILRREINSSRPGGWDLVGGFLKHEDPKEGMLREIKEETGIKINGIELIDVESHYLPDGCFVVMLAFETSVASSNKIILSKEHSEYLWVTTAKIKDLDLPVLYQRFIGNSKIYK